LKKSEIGSTKSETQKKSESGALAAGERAMVKKISHYPDAVERAVVELRPHHVTTYLYELAQAFNSFYEHHRVIGDRRQSARLAIVKAYADVLSGGLTLLGIPAPESM
jgi:arginyl-tRNA synthetase